MITALAGGVGAARFLEGLIHVIPQHRLTIIGNVGDDIEMHDLRISPDLDIVAYTLAGLVDRSKGWGFQDDTFNCQTHLKKLGYKTWFNLGDKDLATHILRTKELRRGRSLSLVTDELVKALGLRVKLLPATDDRFQTYIQLKDRRVHFQEYMVKQKTRPKVYGVTFLGRESAKPTRGLIKALVEAEGVILCPSNPIVSLGAIFHVKGIREAVRRSTAKKIAISPIVGGRTLKGPADKLMAAVGIEPTAFGVAEYYRDLLDALIIDKVDSKLAPKIERLGIKATVTNTVMRTLADKIALAKTVLSELRS